MIMPEEIGLSFVVSLNALTAWANGKSAIYLDDKLSPADNIVDFYSQDQRDTSEWLWENPDPIIDSFVAENPWNLPEEWLRNISAWKNAVTSTFAVTYASSKRRCDGNNLYFLTGDYAVAVTGISQEIESLLTQVPTFVKTTLLPWQGRIVYAAHMVEMRAHLDLGVLQSIEGDVVRARTERKILGDASDFLVHVADIKEAAISREAEEVVKAAEEITVVDCLNIGERRSPLAGLDGAEREAALNATSSKNGEKHYLENFLLPEPVVFTIRELVEAQIRAHIERTQSFIDTEIEDDEFDEEEREYFQAKFKPRVPSPDVLDNYATQYLTDTYAHTMLSDSSLTTINFARRLVEAGGQIETPRAEMLEKSVLFFALSGLYYSFDCGDTITTVMPVEIFKTLYDADWEAIEEASKLRVRVRGFLRAVVELRGISTLKEVAKEYRDLFPVDFPDEKTFSSYCMNEDLLMPTPVRILSSDATRYVMHEYLWNAQFVDTDEYDDPFNRLKKGRLEPMLKVLLAQQKRYVPRPITQEHVESDPFKWKCSLPAAKALRDYFDYHVPDGADDYKFADETVATIMKLVAFGFDIDVLWTIFEQLDNLGYIPPKNQMNTVVGLIMNLFNGTPQWPTNGWAPFELRDAIAAANA